MTKEEFITKVAEAAGIKNKEANAYLNSFIQTLTEVLSNGDTIRLNGLGTFSVKIRSARAGRNPRTGKPLEIPETKVASFSPAKEIKEKVNQSDTPNASNPTKAKKK